MAENIAAEPPDKCAHLEESTTAHSDGTSKPSSNGQLKSPTDTTQDAQERAVGISAYVTPDAPGFSCVVKQRYTDFLVNEILPSGQVLHLVDIAEPAQRKGRGEKASKKANGSENTEATTETRAAVVAEPAAVSAVKRQAEEDAAPEGIESAKRQKLDPSAEEKSTDAGVQGKQADAVPMPTPALSDEDKQILVSIFGEETTEDIVRLYAAVLAHPQRKPREHTTVKSEVISDKSKRTEAHVAVRRVFSSKLETATLQEEPGRMTIKAAPPRPTATDRRSKTQQSTTDGAIQKGRFDWNDLGGEYLHFTLYKENKDTMEVLYFLASQLKTKISTFQFAGTKDRRGVTAQRVSAYRVQKERIQGLTKSARGWKVGGMEYKKHGLDLGELKGNEFQLTLRDCRFQGQEGSNMEQKLQYARDAVAKAAAGFQSSGFVNYYGLQRFGTFSTGTHVTGMKMLQGDLEGAVNSILGYQPDSLPENQDAASEKKVPQDDIDRADALRIWYETGNSRQASDMMPRRFQAESSIIQYLGRKKNGKSIQDRDWQGALMTIQRNLRLMYVHAYQSLIWNTVAGKRWELHGDRVVEGDLVVVGEKDDGSKKPKDETDQDGEPVIHPAGEDSAPTDDDFTRARPLSKVEADSGKYNIFDIVLPLPGWDVEYPKNDLGKYYEELMASEFGGRLDPHQMRRAWKDISLSGGYRKMMSRPGPGFAFDVKAYGSGEEQLVETDVDRLLQRDISANGASSEPSTHEKDKIAVVVKLSLGSSQYATMALRELTKGGAVTYQAEYSAKR